MPSLHNRYRPHPWRYSAFTKAREMRVSATRNFGASQPSHPASRRSLSHPSETSRSPSPNSGPSAEAGGARSRISAWELIPKAFRLGAYDGIWRFRGEHCLRFAGAISEKRMPNSWSTWCMSVILRQRQRNAIRRHSKGRTNMASVARVAIGATSTKCCDALQIRISIELQ